MKKTALVFSVLVAFPVLASDLLTTGSQTGTPGNLSLPWGFSPSWQSSGAMATGAWINSALPVRSQIQLQAKYRYSDDLAPDFKGAPGASVPAFYSEVETSGGSNIQAHAIAGYVVNGGSQDAVAVSGRVIRKAGSTSRTSGLAEASSFYGSAFNFDSLPGVTFGGENVIFNMVAGTTPKDRWVLKEANGATAALHLASISSGSPADAIIAMDSVAGPGYYGVWNGILMDANNFFGSGTPGTVGINGGSWSTHHAPETGIKLGVARQHLWCNAGPCIVNSKTGQIQLFGGDVSAPTTGAGLQLFANASQKSSVDFFAGGTPEADIAYDPRRGSFDVNTLGRVDTHINRGGGNVYVPSPKQTDSSQKAATTAFVKAESGNLNASQIVTGAVSMTQYGVFIETTGSAVYTTTLLTPVASGFAPSYQIWNNSSAPQIFATPRGVFLGPKGSGTSTVTVAPGTSLELISDGTNWVGIR